MVKIFNFTQVVKETKPKKTFDDTPRTKEELEKWLTDLKQQWREIHNRRTARRQRR